MIIPTHKAESKAQGTAETCKATAETRKVESRTDALESEIIALLSDEQFEGQPLREALAALWERHHDYLLQLERLANISDGYQTMMRERNASLAERYRKQIRQLNRIVHISDRYQDMQRDLNDALRIASTHDHLTELPNRRLVLDRLKSEIAFVERGRTTFSLALLDIDRFKSINDQAGHDGGDAVLVRVAQALTQALRGYDMCARWGGEEFLVLLPETSRTGAFDIIERLRTAVYALSHPELSEASHVSISAGLTEFVAGESLDETIKRADVALYEAKAQGRNRVVQEFRKP